MKVKELKELLNKLNSSYDELEVFISPPYEETLVPMYLNILGRKLWIMTKEEETENENEDHE